MNSLAVIPARRRRLPQQQRRGQLLACALAVAARKGLGRTEHTEIAEDAGVSTPTVFSYFPTRRDLLAVVIAEVDRFYTSLGQTYHRSVDDAPKILRRHLDGFLHSIDSDPDYAVIWLEWATLVRNEDGLWDGFLDFQERMIMTVAATVRRGQRDGRIAPRVSADDAARLLTASSYALAQLKFMGRSQDMIGQYLDQVIDLTLG